MNLPKENFLYLLTPELPTVTPGTEEWERIFKQAVSLFLLYLYFKTTISSLWFLCLFFSSDPGSSAEANYKLTIIDEHEGGKVNIHKNDLESHLFIIFLSRCTTWPFPGATQWTKWKEMLPLWQASLSSDRCSTSPFSFSELTCLLKYLQLDTEAFSFWIISPSIQPYTEVVNLTEMNRFCWTNNHPCAGRNGQGGLRTQTTSSLYSRYLSQ